MANSIADLMTFAMQRPTTGQKIGNALAMRQQNKLAGVQQQLAGEQLKAAQYQNSPEYRNQASAMRMADMQSKMSTMQKNLMDNQAKFIASTAGAVGDENSYKNYLNQAKSFGVDISDAPPSLAQGGADWMAQEAAAANQWLSVGTQQKPFAPVEYIESGRRKLAIPTFDPITGNTSLKDVPMREGMTLVAGRATPEEEGRKAFERETGKLEAEFDLKPAVAAEVARAQALAKQEVDKIGENKSNAASLAVYDTAMGSLVEALGGTTTGPVAGWLPAVTSNQQIADGAVAAVAPILKQLFRSAGEGNFTDSDQKILMDMVPTRKDSPEAIKAKLNNIDAIVRAKLNQPDPGGDNQQAGNLPVPQTADDFNALPSGALYIDPDDGKTYRKP